MRHPAINGPAELAGLLPTLLGFVPRESVVTVGLDAKSAVASILRVDIADALAEHTGSILMRSVAAHLDRADCGTAVVLTYTSRAHEDMARTNARVRELSTATTPRDVEHFHVMGNTVTVVLPDGRETMPRAIVARRDLINLGATYTADVEPEDVFDVRYAASVAEKRTASRHGKRWADTREADVNAWRTESYALWETAVSATAASDPAQGVTSATAGKLVAALSDRRVRDAILVATIGHPDLAAGTLAGTSDGEVGRALGTLLSGTGGTPPNVPALRPAWQLLMYLDGHAVKTARAPMLTIAATLKWWSGDSAAALGMIAAAHESEPGYRLAGLLEGTILARIEPGWIQRRNRGEAIPEVA